MAKSEETSYIDEDEPSTSEFNMTESIDSTYPIQLIIKSMMFSYGDSYQPLEACKELILNLINAQLRGIIQKAEKVATFRRCDSIGYCEILFLFRRHPIFIKRLIQYLRMSDIIPLLMQQNTNSFSSVLEPEFNEKNKKIQTLIEALKEIQADNEFSSIFNSLESTVDDIKIERMRRMAIRSERFDVSTYEKFAEARTISFCSKNGRKSQTFANFFKKWIGYPNLEMEIVFILNYCATEILAIIVENAVVCREQEAPNQFEDEYPQNSLQLRHYQEALRRNLGYTKRNDILFGYF